MAEITAGMVKELREKTDAPMMECKKALTEAAGDMARAEEILRVKLGNKASKAASRIAAEGVVGVHVSGDGKLAAIIEINCETDFVAKNDDFLAFARDCAALVAEQSPADVAALAQLPLRGATVESTRAELVGRIGENLSPRRFARIEAQGRIATYIHGGSKIGVVVDVVGGDETLAKDIAMHIAATKPVSLGRDEVGLVLAQAVVELLHPCLGTREIGAQAQQGGVGQHLLQAVRGGTQTPQVLSGARRKRGRKREAVAINVF